MDLRLPYAKEALSFDDFLARCKEHSIAATVAIDEHSRPTHFGLSGSESDESDALKALLAEGMWDAEFGMYLSGHLYRGSPHESSNSCGNCDGARCGDEPGEIPCRKIHSVRLLRMVSVRRKCWTYYPVNALCSDKECKRCGGAGEYGARESAEWG